MSARQDQTLLLNLPAADPLASLRAPNAAIADLAFGSLTADGSVLGEGHLAILPGDALELDLSDPQQCQFGDYELQELIGRGGMGVVYRAYQKSLDREVALKLLAAGPWASRDFIQRFRHEAQNAARMQHPNIVAIYEVGDVDELHYFSMRLVHGGSLAALLRNEGKLAPRRAAQLLLTIAEAVDYAHRLGVLHLDLKPANVLLDDNGAPHVADFGLARRLGNDLSTTSTEVSGTPSYMAPEQAIAGPQKITPATDIWGLGAIGYELVTGQAPYLGKTPHETLKLVVEGQLRNPRHCAPELPRDLEAIILKCLAYDTAQRYASARELAEDLTRFLNGYMVKARPLKALQRGARWAQREPKIVAAALLALLALLVGLAATTLQWRRAESERHLAQEQTLLARKNEATASARLWESRRDAALHLMRDGKGFEALTPLIANIEEQEKSDKADPASIERREIGMIQSQGVTLIGRMIIPDANPMAAALSPDGSLLAVALNDISVRWYDTATLTQRGSVDLSGLPTSDGVDHVPQLLRFIDNHRLSATLEWYTYKSAPGQADMALIDLDAARIIAPPAAFPRLAAVTYDASGQHAMLRDKEGRQQYWQVEPWQPLSLPAATEGLADEEVWLLRSGRLALHTASSQSTLRGFDPRHPGKLHAALPLPRHSSFSAHAESPDGSLMALGDGDGRVVLVDLATQSARQLPVPAGRDVTWLAFSDDGAWLAAARRDGSAFAFDTTTGTLLHSGQMQHNVALSYIAIDHRSRTLLAAGEGLVTAWRLPESGPSATPATRLLSGPTRAARAGLFWAGEAFNAGLLATADMDGEVRLWRLPQAPALPMQTPRLSADIPPFDGEHVTDVAWNRVRIASISGNPASPWIELPQPVDFARLVDGSKTLIAIANTRLYGFAADGLRPRYAPLELEAHPQYFVASADGRVGVFAFNRSGAEGYRLHLRSVDLTTGTLRDGSATLRGPVRELRLSADATRLLAVGPRGDATSVLDATTLQRIGEYPHDPDRPVLWAAFAVDRNQLWLVTRNLDETMAESAELIRWDATNGKTLERRAVAGVWPVGIAVLGDKPLLIGRDRLVFDPGAADERTVPGLQGEPSTEFAISRDGRLIAHVVGRDVQVYDTATLAPVGPALHSDINLLDGLSLLTFDADDRHLLCRSNREWIAWRLGADVRPTAELRAETELLVTPAPGPRVLQLPAAAETQRLRARDPGPWQPPEARPVQPVARLISGKPLPARAKDTSPLLLDLTNFYNMAPDASYNLIETSMPAANQMPYGIARLDGFDYDIRGRIELHFGAGKNHTGAEGEVLIPDRVRGISLPAVPIAALHVLLYAPEPTPVGTEITYANMRLHYHDGSQALMPIRTQHEVPGWTDHDRPVPIGWVHGAHLPAIGSWYQELISNPRLPNPHPEKLIAALDLETSNAAWSVPVVFAITAEPVIPAANSVNTGAQEHVK
jgi:WD40 repeat protein